MTWKYSIDLENITVMRMVYLGYLTHSTIVHVIVQDVRYKHCLVEGVHFVLELRCNGKHLKTL